MFLEVSCVKDLALSLVLLRGGGNFKRWGLVEGLHDTGGVFLKGIMGPLCPPISQFLPCGPVMMVCSCQSPKAMDLPIMDWNLQNCEP
jgi:hypothetical protein